MRSRMKVSYQRVAVQGLFRYIERMEDQRFASSLANGMSVLDAFRDAPNGLTNKELAQRTGLSTASISRLCVTHVDHGMLRFDAAAGRYWVGPGALTLAYPFLSGLGLRRIARLPMARMAAALGGTISLVMRDRAQMVYVETCWGHRPRSFRPDVGAVLPMLQTAAGRAWLASATASERDEVLKQLRATSSKELRKWLPEAAQAAKDLQEHGFCVSAGHWLADIHAVAVPLSVNFSGHKMVLNCGMPASRVMDGLLFRKVGPALRQLAVQIEEEWRNEPQAAGLWPKSVLRRAQATPLVSSAPDSAQTLGRGLDVLACFTPGETVLGNAALARQVGVSAQTMVRLTYTLVRLGLLQRSPTGAGYSLAAGCVALAYPMLANLRMRTLARPGMMALSKQLGVAVSLGLQHRLGMVYVETAWRADGRYLPPDTGSVMPMLSTAMGRAWLAKASASEREALLNQVAVLDTPMWANFGAAVPKALKQYDKHGYCSSRDFRPDIEAIAVPFSRPCGGVRFVMNCGVYAPKPLSVGQRTSIGGALKELVSGLEERCDGA